MSFSEPFGHHKLNLTFLLKKNVAIVVGVEIENQGKRKARN